MKRPRIELVSSLRCNGILKLATDEPNEPKNHSINCRQLTRIKAKTEKEENAAEGKRKG